MTSEINTKGAGASQVEDRSIQPKRAGGNSAAMPCEAHGQTKSSRIKQGGAGDKTTGKNSSWGFAFDGGGNSANGKGEQHGNAKRDSLQGSSRDVPTNISVSQRKNGAGNSSKGGQEPDARGSAKVGPERRFNSQ